MIKPTWINRTQNFVQTVQVTDSGTYRSVPGSGTTLYGTSYGLLTNYYLGCDESLSEQTKSFIMGCQDPETGLMVGPELRDYYPPQGTLHDREHLIWHSTCAALPVCQHFGIELPYPVHAAREFCKQDYLQQWLDARNLTHAWFEGNNILFVGQLLVYLRDVEATPDAQRALAQWFQWLDTRVDPATGLWGTNGDCSPMEAVYGGYHQLLVYYHEDHPLASPRGLIDTVLALQHPDGSFAPYGNGGACEDVDCVDILVNLYKRVDHRRAEIRCALRRCLRHILALQNRDGGFPYNRNLQQTHMGIPGTAAAPNQSTMFATWFRVHTLALMAEILTDEPDLHFAFRFTNNLSMGWHQPWDKEQHQISSQARAEELPYEAKWRRRAVIVPAKLFVRRGVGRTWRLMNKMYGRMARQ